MTKQDISGEIARTQGGIVDQDDARSALEFELSTLRLRKEKLAIEADKIALEQERETLRRIRKNSERRPLVFKSLLIVIGVMYSFFFIHLIRDAFFVCPALLAMSGYAHIVEVALLGIIPTVLVALLMKAVFSATKKQDQDSEIKFSDAIPVRLLTGAVDKHPPAT